MGSVTDWSWGQEAWFRAIFETAAIGISVSDVSGRLLEANPAYQRMMGYDVAALRRMHFLEFTHPEDRSAHTALFTELVAGKRDLFQIEKRYIRSDGQIVWAHLTASVNRDDQGAVRDVVALVEDITERKRAEEALRAEEKRFRAIFHGAPVGIALIDREGRYVSVNAVRQAMLGFSEDELIGRKYEEVTYEADLTYDRQVNEAAREQGQDHYQLEKRFVRRDGVITWARITVSVVRDERGDIQYAISVAEDITERKRVEEERARLLDLEREARTRLEQLAVQKDEFLSAAAHDLRTPLTTIKGRVQILQRLAAGGTVDPEKLTQSLERIDANVTRMAGLIGDLLDVANLQLGRSLTLNRLPVDLVTLAQTVAAEYQQATDTHVILVTARCPEVVGRWDAARLERALGNLLSNAIKYSPRGGEIRVDVSREMGPDGEEAVLSVGDQGIGIPAAELQDIFERFHRAQNVGGTIQGTGIGLTIVRQIVEQHGGRVSVESCEGRGAVFAVRLPSSLD